MCLLSPQPCDLEKVVAYKVMYYNGETHTLTSIMTLDTYKFDQQYEAQPPDPLSYRVGLSFVYDKGFHAYADKEDAKRIIQESPYPPQLYLVEVLLEDVTYEQKKVENMEGDGVTAFGMTHTYVANKCTFRKIVGKGRMKLKVDYPQFISKEIPKIPITSA